MGEKNLKITCPSCNRTDYYKIKPNYCAFCGKKIKTDNKKIKNVLKIFGYILGFVFGIFIVVLIKHQQ